MWTQTRMTVEQMKDAIGKYHGFGDHAHRAIVKAEQMDKDGYEFYTTPIGFYLLSHINSPVIIRGEVYPAQLLLPEEYTE